MIILCNKSNSFASRSDNNEMGALIAISRLLDTEKCLRVLLKADGFTFKNEPRKNEDLCADIIAKSSSELH